MKKPSLKLSKKRQYRKSKKGGKKPKKHTKKVYKGRGKSNKKSHRKLRKKRSLKGGEGNPDYEPEDNTLLSKIENEFNHTQRENNIPHTAKNSSRFLLSDDEENQKQIRREIEANVNSSEEFLNEQSKDNLNLKPHEYSNKRAPV